MDNQTKDRVKRLLDDVEKDIENIEIYFRADTYPSIVGTYEFDFKNMKLAVSVTYINDNINAKYDLSFVKNSYYKTIVSSEDTELLRDFYDTICEEYLRRKAKKKDEKISSLLTELGY